MSELKFLDLEGVRQIKVHIADDLSVKVDKENGKGLSSNDYTTAEKEKLAGLNNYTLPAAGSTLGGVKTGGDVTISDGIITVKDDSHNHTIANVDNLQTSLDAKANKEAGIYYIQGAGTTDTTNKVATWTGTHSDIANYYDGLTIAYKISTAGSTTTTLNINSLGAVPVVKNVTTAISTSYAVNSIIMLTYTTDNGTAYWKIADYDANTKNSAGTSNKVDTKMMLVGATSQTSSGTTTYTNKNVYIGTDNKVYAPGFSGDGASLTALNATQLTSGTVPAARLPVATSSTLGGVKSGSDVVVDSSGYMGVNFSTRAGSADNATTVSIVDLTGNIFEIAASLDARTQCCYFSGSAATSLGGPENYCIFTVQKGINGRTIIDCYALNTQTHYTNGNMDASNTSGWTGWTKWAKESFKNVTVGSTTIAADAGDDTLTLVAGSNVTLTPDATNDKITIAATDTTYSAATTSAAGLMSAADKTKLDGIATGANKYTLPVATNSTLGGIKTGNLFNVDSDGTISDIRAR